MDISDDTGTIRKGSCLLTKPSNKIVPMKHPEAVLRNGFIGWQCRLRQLSVRDAEARPTSGMRPRLTVAGQGIDPITVVITKLEPEISTAEFRHLVRKTRDPRERYQSALRFLQASYYQDPKSFGDLLTAVFSVDAKLPMQIDGRADCILDFEQYSQSYRLTCTARLLQPKDRAFQATYWHNALFNASLPSLVQVIGFRPDWRTALAEPSPR